MKHIKQEFDKLTFKEVLIYWMAVIAMLGGLTMLFLGMYIDPRGEIHPSVLTAFGSICIFVASLLGISIHYDNELTKFKDSVTRQLDGRGAAE